MGQDGESDVVHKIKSNRHLARLTEGAADEIALTERHVTEVAVEIRNALPVAKSLRDMMPPYR